MAYEHITPIACATAIVLALASGSAWGQCITTNGHLIANQTNTGDCPAGSVPIFASSSAPANLIASRPARAYTLDEIDRMRVAVSQIMNPPCPGWCNFSGPDAVEQRLRTYLAAGVSPEALEARAKEGK